jgi:hypothetical protein
LWFEASSELVKPFTKKVEWLKVKVLSSNLSTTKKKKKRKKERKENCLKNRRKLHVAGAAGTCWGTRAASGAD